MFVSKAYHNNLLLNEDLTMTCNQGIMHTGKDINTDSLQLWRTGPIAGLHSWMNCNSCFWHPTDSRISTSRPGRKNDTWSRELIQIATPGLHTITLTTAHTSAYKPNVFLPWAQLFASFKNQAKQTIGLWTYVQYSYVSLVDFSFPRL